jgi:hypothetical protein
MTLVGPQRLLILLMWLGVGILARQHIPTLEVVYHIIMFGVAGAGANYALRFRESTEVYVGVQRVWHKFLRFTFALVATAGAITGTIVLLLEIVQQPIVILAVGVVLLGTALYSVVDFLWEYWRRLFA